MNPDPYAYLHSWSSFWFYSGASLILLVLGLVCAAIPAYMAHETYHAACEHDLTEQGWTFVEDRGLWSGYKIEAEKNHGWYTMHWPTKRQAVSTARTMVKDSEKQTRQLEAAMKQHD